MEESTRIALGEKKSLMASYDDKLASLRRSL